MNNNDQNEALFNLSSTSQESSPLSENRSGKRRLITVAVAVVIIVISIAGYQFGWFKGQQSTANGSFAPPPPVVSVANAKTMLMSPATTLPGTVVSLRDAVIAAETSGKVVSVALVGDLVEKGDALATIDQRNAQQRLAQSKAELARLESLYQYHKNYFARVNIDDESLGIPEIGVAELRSNMETAKADVARSQSELIAAQTDLERTTITAPFSGRIVSQAVQPGEFAQIGSPIARLVDTTSLEISAQVPAALVQPIEPGTALEVSGFGKRVLAPLRALVPVGNEISRTMEVRITLPAADFLVGSPVRVTLPTATPKQVLAIPRDAIILRPNSQYVFVVDDNKKAHKQEVTLGYSQDEFIEVTGKLGAGDRVIVRGGERLRDGQIVTFDDSKQHSDSLSQTN